MLDRLSLRARRTLSAWAFLALPILFYGAIRFYPTADALLTSLTDWNIVGPRRFVGLDNYRRLLADPIFWKVMGNTFQYLIVGVVREPRAVLSRGLPPRPDPRRPRAPPRALLRAPPHDRGGHGVGLEVALPAGADRPLQRPPGVGGPLAAAVPALHRAGALRRPGARRLGGSRIPDRDLPGRPEGDPAGVLRGGGDRRRRELADAGGRHAPAPPADRRLSRRRQLDRVSPDLRLRLQHDATARAGRSTRPSRSSS